MVNIIFNVGFLDSFLKLPLDLIFKNAGGKLTKSKVKKNLIKIYSQPPPKKNKILNINYLDISHR